jgi:succinate dehydrogenase/fumarate reductase flavoprotein subunit
MHNPKGLEGGFRVLPDEAYDYLSRSDVLFGTPIERLDKMNRGAVDLYASHGIDLHKDLLEIAVCAQHCNGGVTVDANWQTEIEGLYVAGEAAGTFGVYRPGGSALNSTQVGSLRAAEHIAKKERREVSPKYELPKIKYGTSNLESLRLEYQTEMSRVADFDRRRDGMRALFDKVSDLCENFFEVATISDPTETAELFKLYDMALTQRSALSAMIKSADEIGTHGAAFIDRLPDTSGAKRRENRTVTYRGVSEMKPVSPMPNPELWFETLLARQLKTNKK